MCRATRVASGHPSSSDGTALRRTSTGSGRSHEPRPPSAIPPRRCNEYRPQRGQFTSPGRWRVRPRKTKRNSSCSLVSFARVVASQILAPSARARRITARDSRESSKSICKEIALQRPKTGKFDYLCTPGHSAHSMASEFFTDDDLQGHLTPDASAPRWRPHCPNLAGLGHWHGGLNGTA